MVLLVVILLPIQQIHTNDIPEDVQYVCFFRALENPFKQICKHFETHSALVFVFLLLLQHRNRTTATVKSSSAAAAVSNTNTTSKL